MLGCTPEATPFPVDIPTAVSTSPAGSQSTLRYALAANTDGLVSDLELIQSDAQIEQLTEPIATDDLGSRYDLVASYGELPDGVRSPVTQHIALILNPAIAPLDDTLLLGIIRRSLNTHAIVTAIEIPGTEAIILESSPSKTLRTELANAGLPDGISIILAYAYTPGITQVAEQLQSAGIRAQLLALNGEDVTTAFEDGRIQAALIMWKTPEERQNWVELFESGNVIDLYSVPISYLAINGLEIEFTENGWPIPAG